MISNFPFFPPFYGNSYRRSRAKGYMDTPNSNFNQPNSKYSKNYNSQLYHPYAKSNDNCKPDNYKNINNSYNNENNKANVYTSKLYNSSNSNNNTSTSTHSSNNEFSESTRNKNSESLYNPNEYFEILGIKLHYDDILLICLIFFLYKEGVKDETLFIGLILLLLS